LAIESLRGQDQIDGIADYQNMINSASRETIKQKDPLKKVAQPSVYVSQDGGHRVLKPRNIELGEAGVIIQS